MSLAELVLSAMIAWIAPAEHRHLEPERVTAARYQAIASDIAAGVAEAAGERVEGSAELEGLLLASIAAEESHYAARVDRCDVGRGGAWSIFQVTAPRSRVCASRRAAVAVALAMVRESWRECARLAPGDRLGFYTDGRCREHWWRSRVRAERAVGWLTSGGPA